MEMCISNKVGGRPMLLVWGHSLRTTAAPFAENRTGGLVPSFWTILREAVAENMPGLQQDRPGQG